MLSGQLVARLDEAQIGAVAGDGKGALSGLDRVVVEDGELLLLDRADAALDHVRVDVLHVELAMLARASHRLKAVIAVVRIADVGEVERGAVQQRHQLAVAEQMIVGGARVTREDKRHGTDGTQGRAAQREANSRWARGAHRGCPPTVKRFVPGEARSAKTPAPLLQ